MPDDDSARLRQSPDDALEDANPNRNDIYNPTRDDMKLEEDNDPPAAPAAHTGAAVPLPEDHQVFDAAQEFDTHETYDEGKLGATDTDAWVERSPSPNEPLPLEPKDDETDT